MHIPKSAGTSLSDALRTAIEPRAFFSAFDRCNFGSFSDFESISEDIRKAILTDPAEIPPGVNLIIGHMSFSTTSQINPSAQFMTILREPASRLMSFWLFWRSKVDENLAPWGGWGEYVRLSRRPLREFIRARNISCQVDNQSLRMLLWPHPLVPADDFIDERHDEELVQAAASRLDRFDFVDVIENPDMVVNLQNWLGRPLIFRKLNETEDIPDALKSPVQDELDSETLALIEHRSRLDLKLWQEVVSQRLPQVDLKTFRDQARAESLARHCRLMTI
jgi:Sulfotransferase family